MPRVLLVFEPPDGGVPEAVRHLVAGLPALGWEVEVAAPPASQIDPQLRGMGAPVHRLSFRRGYRSPASDARVAVDLVRLLRSHRFDLVHAHSSKAGALARLAGAVTRVPAVYTPHCFGFLGPVGRARRLFSHAVERLLSPMTAVIICVCEYEREMAERAHIGRRDRLRTVRNGSQECADAVHPDDTLQALRGNGVLAVALAALRPQKRLETLIEATPDVLARLPRARVAIVGSGPTETDLRARADALGLMDDPRFAILPFRPPVSPYLHASDVFVLPSAWEALPIGVLEAMACGIPQVCTDVGGVGEAVDEATGRLVTADDPAALTQAMIEVMSDSGLRASMGASSRARHAERFLLGRVAEETAAVYDEALATRS